MATTVTVNQFHWADYLVFVINLLISAVIGFYYGFAGEKQKTTKDFLVGGRSMHPLPVALSLLASFTSAPYLVGIPAEIYFFGTMYQLVAIGQILSCIMTAYTFAPIFHKMELTSAYEYLEHRFSKSVRIMGSVVFTLKMTMYMAVVIYAPSMAFSRVTGMSTWVSILATGLVCTFYTAVGGMKAVVWADVVQMIIIIVGILVLVVMGAVRVGSLETVWQDADKGGRVIFDVFDPNPTTRHTFWTQSIGGLFVINAALASNQVTIQRFLSIAKLSDVRKCLAYALGFLLFNNVLILLLGLVLYAVYGPCDPLSVGQIKARDQLVPMFVMDVLGKMHGLPGLFAAAVFSATLSTVSSGLNALAAVILLDMISPAYKKIKGGHISEEAATKLSKALAAGMGFIVIGLAYLSPYLGPTLAVICLSLFGMIGGPLLGLFSLAIFFPKCNWKGAAAGLWTSLIITMWVAVGAIVHPNRPIPLPVRTDGCPVVNSTVSYLNMSYTDTVTSSHLADITTSYFADFTPAPAKPYGGLWIYKVSYMWLSVISVVVCVIVGMAVSYMTGKQEKVNPSLVINWSDVKVDICNTLRYFKSCICCGENPVMPTPVSKQDKEVQATQDEEQETMLDKYGKYLDDHELLNGTPTDHITLSQESTGLLSREQYENDLPARRSIYWEGPEITWNEKYISSV